MRRVDLRIHHLRKPPDCGIIFCMEKINKSRENIPTSLEKSEQAGILKLAEQFQISTQSTLRDLALLNSLSDKLPNLSDDPSESLLAVHDFLVDQNFTYEEGSMTLHDVIERKSGNCLSLCMLVCALLEDKGKRPSCKMLIHPKDKVDDSDRKLFRELTGGEYFSYDNPRLPDVSKQSQDNRFIPLGHPIVTLDGIPFETTLIDVKDSDPLIEFPSESSKAYSSQELVSFVYSDQAKLLVNRIHESKNDDKDKLLDQFHALLEKSLAILPDNRYAIRLLWQYAKEKEDKTLETKCLERYKSMNFEDSEYNYSLWTMTGDVVWLDRSLQQFPENIPAFIDKHVFLEKDPKEARFNLAVAMGCVLYSGSLSLKSFYDDPQIQKKIEGLFPKS